MKKRKFPILLKVIILGIGVSILTSGISLVLSYFNQRSSAKENLLNNLNYTLNAVDNTFSDLENKNTPTYVSYLQNLRDYVEQIYEGDEEKSPMESFDSFSDFAQSYAEKYPWLYTRNPRMGFISQEEANFRIGSYTIANLLDNFQKSSGSPSVFLAFIDENNTMIFLYDSRMIDDLNHDDYYHVPGYYYQFKDSDYFDEFKQENHQGYMLDGYRTLFTPIYSLPTGEELPHIIANLYIQYDLNAVNEGARSVLLNELLILGLSSLVLIAIYTVVSYLLFVKNINKLSKSSTEIKKRINDKNMNEIVDIPIKSNDEMGDLADSLIEMEKAIINYVDIIHNEAQEKERYNAELSIASKIQLDSLPADKYYDKNVDLRAYIKAAKEVGGDFYDYFYLDNHRLAILISDVSGKGVPASLFMMKNKELLKSSLMSYTSLKEAIKNVNNTLSKNNNELLFITSFVGVIDFEKKEIRYINAGHEKPYIVNSKGIYKLDGEPNIVLGIEENYSFIEEKHAFNKGDFIFMFTDGLNESINHDFEEFGYQRIEQILTNNLESSTDDVIDAINNGLNEFVINEEQFDDVTILIAKYQDDELKLHYETKDYGIITDVVDRFNHSFAFFDDKTKAAVGIVIDELVNNLISYENREDLTIDVEFKLFNDDLKIIITSNGSDYDPFSNHQEKYLQEYNDEIKEGGFGLSIVKDFAKSYSYKYKNKHSIVEILI